MNWLRGKKFFSSSAIPYDGQNEAKHKRTQVVVERLTYDKKKFQNK